MEGVHMEDMHIVPLPLVHRIRPVWVEGTSKLIHRHPPALDQVAARFGAQVMGEPACAGDGRASHQGYVAWCALNLCLQGRSCSSGLPPALACLNPAPFRAGRCPSEHIQHIALPAAARTGSPGRMRTWKRQK